MNRRYIITLALAFASSVIAFAAHAADVKNIVIVRGALADGSGWRKATEILESRGFHVTIVQQPITSLADDVAATERILDLQDGPSLLVGHSYGGMVITEAGNRPDVAGLVYVAAFQPTRAKACSTSRVRNHRPARTSRKRQTASISTWTRMPSPKILQLICPSPKPASWQGRRFSLLRKRSQQRSTIRRGRRK